MAFLVDGPDEEQAHAFCVMLQAGLPAEEALLYFVETSDPQELSHILHKWQKSRRVRKAQLALLGKSWQEMSDDDRRRTALSQHYNQLAYFLFTNHYASLSQQDKAKADTARTTLEAKEAGQAGRGDALTRFFDDVQTGRVKLSAAPIIPKLN